MGRHQTKNQFRYGSGTSDGASETDRSVLGENATAGVDAQETSLDQNPALLGYILPARISHMDRYWIFQELKGSWMENLKQKMGAIWLSAWP